jgi:hypothetical protein
LLVEIGQMPMPVQKQVDALCKQPATVWGVAQVVERMMDQGKPEAFERFALLVRGERIDLTIRQENSVGIIFIAAQPGGIEADNVQAETAPLDRSAVSESLRPISFASQSR